MSNFTSSSSLANDPKTTPPNGVSNSQMVKASIASVLGWSLDLFDLFILLYVAPVIGHVFFPSDVPLLSLAAVYASFAVTLIIRPVGSAIFGAYADKHRKKGRHDCSVYWRRFGFRVVRLLAHRWSNRHFCFQSFSFFFA